MAKGWLIGAGIFLGAILIASIVVVILEKEEPLPVGTPEAAVQLFLKGVEDESFELAYGFLSSDLMVDCAVDEFFGTTGGLRDRLIDDRITLEGVKTVKDTAFVTVRFTRFHGTGPFGASESSYEQRFSLRQEDGEWRFTEYPWPFFRCGPFKPVIETHPTPSPTRPAATPAP